MCRLHVCDGFRNRSGPRAGRESSRHPGCQTRQICCPKSVPHPQKAYITAIDTGGFMRHFAAVAQLCRATARSETTSKGTGITQLFQRQTSNWRCATHRTHATDWTTIGRLLPPPFQSCGGWKKGKGTRRWQALQRRCPSLHCSTRPTIGS